MRLLLCSQQDLDYWLTTATMKKNVCSIQRKQLNTHILSIKERLYPFEGIQKPLRAYPRDSFVLIYTSLV